MPLTEKWICKCGQALNRDDFDDRGNVYCRNCNSYWSTTTIGKRTEELLEALEERLGTESAREREEALARHISRLWRETHDDIIYAEKIERALGDIYALIGENFVSEFHGAILRDSTKDIKKMLDSVTEEQAAVYLSDIIDFICRVTQKERVVLVARDAAEKFRYLFRENEYLSMQRRLTERLKDIDASRHSVRVKRDVYFVYCDDERGVAERLAAELSERGKECFLPHKNLSFVRSSGADELKTAMDHCGSLVFVSSTGSRSDDELCSALDYWAKHKGGATIAEYVVEEHRAERRADRELGKFFAADRSFRRGQEEELFELLCTVKENNGGARIDDAGEVPVAAPRKPSVLKVGDGISFGRYRSDKPVTWRVIRREGNEYLLLAEQVLDHYKFAVESNSYLSSDLKRWLNDSFFDRAFNAAEAEMILTKKQGRVFVLSRAEAEELLPRRSDRVRYPTEFAARGEAWMNGQSAEWWLRDSDEDEEIFAQIVCADGDFGSRIINHDYTGVLPAIWIRYGDI